MLNESTHIDHHLILKSVALSVPFFVLSWMLFTHTPALVYIFIMTCISSIALSAQKRFRDKFYFEISWVVLSLPILINLPNSDIILAEHVTVALLIFTIQIMANSLFNIDGYLVQYSTQLIVAVSTSVIVLGVIEPRWIGSLGYIGYCAPLFIISCGLQIVRERPRRIEILNAIVCGVLIAIILFSFGHSPQDIGGDTPLQWTTLRFLTAFIIAVMFIRVITHSHESDNSSQTSSLLWPVVGIGCIVLFIASRVHEFTSMIEVRKHMDYCIGLFSLLGRNLAENGYLMECGQTVPPSEGHVMGEPDGCWVNRTGWWQIPVHIMALSSLLGLNTTYVSRFVALITKLASAYLIQIILKHSGISRRGRILALVAYLMAPQTSFYGRIFTAQLFEEFIALVVCYLFQQDWMKQTKRSMVLALISLLFLQLIHGWEASAFAVILSLFNFIISTRNNKIKLLIIAYAVGLGLLSLFIWSTYVEFVASGWTDGMWEKAKVRSQSGILLLQLQYYIEVSGDISRLIGPILLGTGFGGLITLFMSLKRRKWKKDMRDNPEIAIGATFVLVALAHYLLFAQSSMFHDYWAYFHVTGLAIIFGRLSEIMPERVIRTALLSSLLINLTDWWWYEEEPAFPQYASSQHYLASYVEKNDVVLLEQSIYSVHYLAYLSGENLIHRHLLPHNVTLEQFAEQYDIDHILITHTAYNETWDVTSLEESTEWCHFDLPTIAGQESMHAFSKCD